MNFAAIPGASTTTGILPDEPPTVPGTVDHACRLNGSDLCRKVWDLTQNTGLSYAVDAASAVIRVFLILLVAYILIRLSRVAVKRIVSDLQGDVVQKRLAKMAKRTPRALQSSGPHLALRRAQRAETIGALLRSTATLIVGVVTFFAVLQQFSINLVPLVASAGVATAALAFGAQNIVRDFLAGLFIVVEDQYGVGDVIDVGVASGTVEAVSFRITRLRDSEGTLWHVPNGEIKKAGNKSQQWARALLEFRVALDTDIATAVRTMKATADEMWQDSAYAGIITEEPEVWGPEAIDKEGIYLRLAVKTRPMEQWHVSRALRGRVKKAFDAAGIEIAKA